MPFSQLGLTDNLVRSVQASGYEIPTPIQQRAIPLAITGKDILGCANTGTGKTAAFVLPLLHRLDQLSSARKGNHVKALILTPTRELAQQVEEYLSGMSRFTSFRSISIYGGANMENQIKRLRRGVDIVVATPGRLLDHINRKTINLSNVEYFVLDEADKMFDMGFIDDVRTIVSKLASKRQTLLFSATISEQIKKLAVAIQDNPEVIQIGEQRRPMASIHQRFYSIEQDVKRNLLVHLLKKEAGTSVLVFSRTKHGADKISKHLSRSGFNADSIHSDRTQSQRTNALARFKGGKTSILVATDVASRGIDVSGITHVVNFDVPRFPEDYIHRIGRTGRASASGHAISFVSKEERKFVRRIEGFVGKKFEFSESPVLEKSSFIDEEIGKNERKKKHHHRSPMKGKNKGDRGVLPGATDNRKKQKSKKKEYPSTVEGWMGFLSSGTGNQGKRRKKRIHQK